MSRTELERQRAKVIVLRVNVPLHRNPSLYTESSSRCASVQRDALDRELALQPWDSNEAREGKLETLMLGRGYDLLLYDRGFYWKIVTQRRRMLSRRGSREEKRLSQKSVGPRFVSGGMFCHRFACTGRHASLALFGRDQEYMSSRRKRHCQLLIAITFVD